MLKLRPNTIKEIQSILDESYFTKDSFSVINDPARKSFLSIKFVPTEGYTFTVKTLKDDYITNEKPGKYLETVEAYTREDFDLVLLAIRSWVERIKEDLDSREFSDRDLELFLNKLRASFLSYKNEAGYFTNNEILELNRKLEALEILVLGKTSSFNIPESCIISFQETIESIKKDLNKYQKNIWYTISGNKIIKEVKGVVNYADLQGRNKLQHKLIELLH